MYSVYALVDPRDQAIRYVGMSKNVWRRYAMHLLVPARTAPAKTAWIEELRQMDLSPLLAILETSQTEKEASQRETYWIQHYLSQGAGLLNVAKRGGYIQEAKGDSITAQIARKLRMSEDAIIKMLYRQEIPGRNVGNQWEIDPDEFRQWLASRANGYYRGPAQEN